MEVINDTPANPSVEDALRRLNVRAWGITLGVLFGGTLFVATVVLVIKGGVNVGEHLSLLSNYFPGYRVSWPGAFVGFMYGFVLGYGIGRVVGGIYNRLAR